MTRSDAPKRSNPHFLGVPVSGNTKEALQREARRRSAEAGRFVGAAAVAREAIEAHLALPPGGADVLTVKRRSRHFSP